MNEREPSSRVPAQAKARSERDRLLRLVAAVSDPMLHGQPVDSTRLGTEWTSLAEVLLTPARLRAAIDDYGARFEAPTTTVAASLFARSLTTAVAWIALSAWGWHRIGIDLRPGELAYRVEGFGAVVLAVRPSSALTVGPRGSTETVQDDAALAHAVEAGLVVRVASEAELREWVLSRSFDESIAPIIESICHEVRMGRRHLWGNVAVTAANLFTTISHERPGRADADRAVVLAHRPELSSTIRLVTESDDDGDAITFAHRLTCCLLVKVPNGVLCSTCSLRPETERVARTGAWYRAERRSSRSAAGGAAGRHPGGAEKPDHGR